HPGRHQRLPGHRGRVPAGDQRGRHPTAVVVRPGGAGVRGLLLARFPGLAVRRPGRRRAGGLAAVVHRHRPSAVLLLRHHHHPVLGDRARAVSGQGARPGRAGRAPQAGGVRGRGRRRPGRRQFRLHLPDPHRQGDHLPAVAGADVVPLLDLTPERALPDNGLVAKRLQVRNGRGQRRPRWLGSWPGTDPDIGGSRHRSPNRTRTGGLRRVVRRWTAVLAALLCCGMLAACLADPGSADRHASPGSSPAPTDDRNPAARDALAPGGELRIGVTGPHTQWSPWHRDTLFTAMPRVLDPVTPQFFVTDAAGQLVPDPDYLVGEPVATGDPLVVTLRLNPDAVWADGKPITWEDVRAPLAACRKPGAECVDTTGPHRVVSVTRGATDFEAVVTFAGPAHDWRTVLRAP